MTFVSIIHLFSSFRNVLILSLLIRVVLILYSDWHDARSIVKYTDVDYRVFSDAARFLLHPGPGNSNRALGPLKSLSGYEFNVGDPYTRETYRYTPLLALLLAPNEWLHPSFGKYVFALCDIINGILIYNLLVAVILPNLSIETKQVSPEDQQGLQQRAALYSAIYLLNPMVFSISTRGSSESLLSLLVLLTLYAVLKERWNAAAVLLGLSTHWKIYPAIYGVACVAAIAGWSTNGGWASYFKNLINWRTFKFGVLSVSSFGIVSGICYLIWGQPFLYESYLYHLNRLDHRHNFAPYFYLTYLTYPSLDQPSNSQTLAWWHLVLRSPLVSFVPQMTLALGTGLLFGHTKDNLPFTWFLQTYLFVTFNKVCTSQYFLWYLLFLPLILPRLRIPMRTAIGYIATWVAVQAFWLSEAYRLEFLAQNVFFQLWIRSLVYVIGNCWVIAGVMEGYVSHSDLVAA